MRWTLLSLTLLAAFAQADASCNCYSIKDMDKQRYCLASVKGDPSRCYSIRAHDGKQLCLAETKGTRSTCYSIKDKDTQRLCLANVPR
ncbi:hypothetical protein H8F21_14085 [Pseudomonas sp. P66]|uniref:Uncharacterized protein n=1 Tax=Pseudomonas arcuscaelestis TaxID=2710591 RepID=A0ABS2BYM2_9PSED|nr:hypothetical protein [Pseudomonas arcuscaelestis]MBM5458694.1 hypothetical protein [Pseudomonas arcuscaelestis]